MVFCRYCGKKNKDKDLHCVNCGKPLSLLPNKYQEDFNPNSLTNSNNKLFKKKSKDNFSQKPIKKHYENNNFRKENNKNEKGYNSYFESKYKSYGDKQVYKSEISKNSVEWDVIVATALLVIILAAIFKRIFPNIGLFFAMLIGLIYILIATKSKSTLLKAIPLAIMMIFAISAYFVI